MEFPKFGIGTYKLRDEETINNVLKTAYELNYRMIDTAELYKNQEYIGKFIEMSKIDRKSIWITTKVSFKNMRKSEKDIVEGINRTFIDLRTDYIDLYLIHCPIEKTDNMLFTWNYLRKLKEEGKIRYIGISNFPLEKLKNFIKLIGEDESKHIYCNQIECNPYHNRKELRDYCKERNIKITAYGSLYKITDDIKKIGEELNRTPYQILLKWALQEDIRVIPMADKMDYIRMNADLDFDISEDNMKLLNSLNENYSLWPRYN
jgi:diketogulonate reductase-like aldo/keto reductase